MNQITKYQKSRKATINRSDIQNAAYNPRKIDKAAKTRLKQSIKDHGYVGGIVYNRRTGNIVGGHQRIEQIDELEGRSDYMIEVDEIDVDLDEEMEINIVLNTSTVGGAWDTDKLSEIIVNLQNKGRSVNRTGLTAFDIAELCGDIVLQGQFKEQRDAETPIIDELSMIRDMAREVEKSVTDLPSDTDGKEPSLAVPTPTSEKKYHEKTPEEKRQELADRRVEYAGEISQEEDADTLISFVFIDNDTRDYFLKYFKLDRTKRYFDTYEVQEAFKVQLIQ